MDMTEKEIEYYTALDGKCPYVEWRDSLCPDYQVRVAKRLNPMRDGNYGDWKNFKTVNYQNCA